jgi:hypothetical protein
VKVKGSKWAASLRCVPLLIAGFTVLYAFVDYFGWSDSIFGRTTAKKGLQRLASSKDMPESLIRKSEPEFPALFKLIVAQSPDSNVKQWFKQGHVPDAISRLGGTFSVPMGNVDAGVNASFAADVSLVTFMYITNSTKKLPWPAVASVFMNTTNPSVMTFDFGPPFTPVKGYMIPVARLGDIQQWITAAKERERFIISTVCIGLLSLVVTLIDFAKPKPAESPAQPRTP